MQQKIYNILDSLYWRLTYPIPVIIGIAILISAYFVPNLIKWNVTQTAEESAQEFVLSFQNIRDYYTDNVVRVVQGSSDIEVSALHLGKESTIPVPGTFLLEMLQGYDSAEVSLQLTSPFPFAYRSGRRMDGFQTRAWEALLARPDTAFSRQETLNGQRVVRVAIADRMVSETCVDCHNTHPASTKRDWRLGDVRGMIDLTFNVEETLARGQVIGTLLMILILTAMGVLFVANHICTRAVTGPLGQMTDAIRGLAAGRRNVAQPARSNIREVQALAEAFEKFRIKDGEREKLARETERLAFRDPLTDLSNRTQFLRNLTLALDRMPDGDPGLVVVLLDIDHFSDINDTLGHKTGDEILRLIAARLRAAFPGNDGMACLGGDRFAVFLLGKDGPGDPACKSATRRMQDAFLRPFEVGDATVTLTFSTGAAEVAASEADASDLLAQADIALKQAKNQGRGGHVVYSAELSDSLHQRMDLLHDLRLALKEDILEPYFQPQFDLGTGDLVGAEALLRWRRADGSFVSPEVFIPIAEQAGLIRDIGQLVLRKTCAYARDLREKGLPPLRMAVNVSVLEFEDEGFVDGVKQALADHGLKAAELELEITESVTVGDIERVIEILRQLHDLGIEIAIDDFGTGYSALSVLKRRPADRLKIDQSFVADLGDGGGGLAVARTIVALAHALGLRVLAEGVEEVEQEAALMAIGCHEVQGYYYAKPVSTEDFEAFYRSFLQDRAIATGGGRTARLKGHEKAAKSSS